MKMHLSFAFALAIVLAALPRLGAAEMEFKIAIATPDGHHATEGLRRLTNNINEKTGGRIKATLFVGGQLISGERELMDGLQFGTVDIGLVSTGMMSAYDDKFMIFSLPYLFRDVQNAYKTCDGPIGDAFRKIIDDKIDVVILGWTMGGIHTITTTKRPVNKMADLAGLKLRCMENPIITEAWKAYGAVPTPMSLGEVFTALQQGAIDGQDNGTANTYANKYYEVQKYLVMTEHMIVPGLIAMAKEKYDAIPADLKPAFDEAVRDAVQFQREEYGRQDAAAVSNMKAKGMEVLYPDKADFLKAAAGVREGFIKRMGAEMAGWVKDIQEKY